MEKTLLFGSTGQLGSQVVQAVPDSVQLHSSNRDALDITDHEAVRQAIEQIQPDVIINTAAYTKVDQAEQEKEAAFKVNAQAVENIANSAPAETRIIHLSTDFVFSKASRRPYKPDDITAPVSVYGSSKLAGEQALLSHHNNNAIIIRTSWLYSATGRNFVTSMLNLLSTREELNVVNDQFGSPTAAKTLAQVIWRFVLQKKAEGLYHWSDKGIITWYDFASEIQRRALELEILDRKIPINPIPTSAYTTLADRPVYSALDTAETESKLEIQAVSWQKQLYEVLKTIKKSN